MAKVATPRPGSVMNARGKPCLRAEPEDYPLYASCDHCSLSIKCADGTAEWCHIRDYRAACP